VAAEMVTGEIVRAGIAAAALPNGRAACSIVGSSSELAASNSPNADAIGRLGDIDIPAGRSKVYSMSRSRRAVAALVAPIG
jgi:hypothetical protein